MKAIVGDTGVLIPRRMLRGVKEVDIRKQGRNIVVEPSTRHSDPIFDLGKTPVHSGVNDGAEHHDAHLYNGS
jgi:virulence-associated protein VagC